MPFDCPLIAGIHTAAALDTVLKLEGNLAEIVQLITLGRAHECGAMVRALSITDFCINQDMRFRVASSLVTVGYEPESF